MIDRFKSDKKPELYNPLVLAYLGDAVYELYIRSYLVSRSSFPAGELHKQAKKYVSASAQSGILGAIEGILTEEELAIYKRGRNSNSASSPKNADMAQYRRATGLEALIGYLYLKGNDDRLDEIIGAVIDQVGE